MKVKSLSRVRLLATPWTAAYQEPTRLLRPWDFPAKSTGVGCQFLLLHAHQAEPNLTAPGKRSYACFAKSHQSCPTLHGPVNCNPLGSSVHGNLLKWAAMPSARGSSRPRDRTRISCGSLHLGRILYHRATWADQGEASLSLFPPDSAPLLYWPVHTTHHVSRGPLILREEGWFL